MLWDTEHENLNSPCIKNPRIYRNWETYHSLFLPLTPPPHYFFKFDTNTLKQTHSSCLRKMKQVRLLEMVTGSHKDPTTVYAGWTVGTNLNHPSPWGPESNSPPTQGHPTSSFLGLLEANGFIPHWKVGNQNLTCAHMLPPPSNRGVLPAPDQSLSWHARNHTFHRQEQAASVPLRALLHHLCYHFLP